MLFFTHMAQFSNYFGLAIDNFYKKSLLHWMPITKIKVLITFFYQTEMGED